MSEVSPNGHAQIAEPPDPGKRCAACQECDDRRGNVSPGAPSWETIPELAAREDLVAYPGIQRTEERHIADPDGILALYSFGQDVECSLKGQHKHRSGLVVKTLCDLILCMGYDCGKLSIVGFENIERTSKARRQFQRDVRHLANWEKGARLRLDSIARRVQACEEIAETMHRHLFDLHVELIARRKKRAAGTAVTLPKRDRSNLPEEFRNVPDPTIHLVGLAILDSKHAAVNTLRGTLAHYQKLHDDSPPIDGPSADTLRRTATLFRERAESLEDWLNDAISFLSERNLNLALIALGKANSSVRREDGGWRVSYMPGVTALLPTIQV